MQYSPRYVNDRKTQLEQVFPRQERIPHLGDNAYIYGDLPPENIPPTTRKQPVYLNSDKFEFNKTSVTDKSRVLSEYNKSEDRPRTETSFGNVLHQDLSHSALYIQGQTHQNLSERWTQEVKPGTQRHLQNEYWKDEYQSSEREQSRRQEDEARRSEQEQSRRQEDEVRSSELQYNRRLETELRISELEKELHQDDENGSSKENEQGRHWRDELRSYDRQQQSRLRTPKHQIDELEHRLLQRMANNHWQDVTQRELQEAQQRDLYESQKREWHDVATRDWHTVKQQEYEEFTLGESAINAPPGHNYSRQNKQNISPISKRSKSSLKKNKGNSKSGQLKIPRANVEQQGAETERNNLQQNSEYYQRPTFIHDFRSSQNPTQSNFLRKKFKRRQSSKKNNSPSPGIRATPDRRRKSPTPSRRQSTSRRQSSPLKRTTPDRRRNSPTPSRKRSASRKESSPAQNRNKNTTTGLKKSNSGYLKPMRNSKEFGVTINPGFKLPTNQKKLHALVTFYAKK